MKKIILLSLFSCLLISCSSQSKKQTELSDLSWDQITRRADGQTVSWMMDQGSPFINGYINNYVIPTVKKRYNIDLKISAGQGNQIVSTLMKEQEAGKKSSDVDMAWINGSTFFQLRQIDALYGPFAQQLPNAKFVDFDNPFISRDFQQEVDGYESPWSLTQFVMVYNRANVSQPPHNMDELAAYVKKHPGTFTIPNQFTGMTFLKTLLMNIAGDDTLGGKFDQQKYDTYSSKLWSYLNRIKPYFWKQGQTFPSKNSTLIQLFASGEINFGMTFGANSLEKMVRAGFLPKSARAYLWDRGTIQNTNYIGISKNAAHKAGAMVVANFLLSPEAQYKKMQPSVMGSRTVLDRRKLPAKWQQKFDQIPEAKFAPSRSELKAHARQELGPQYMIHISEDFRKKVIQQ